MIKVKEAIKLDFNFILNIKIKLVKVDKVDFVNALYEEWQIPKFNGRRLATETTDVLPER